MTAHTVLWIGRLLPFVFRKLLQEADRRLRQCTEHNKTRMRVTAASPSAESKCIKHDFWHLRTSEQHANRLADYDFLLVS